MKNSFLLFFLIIAVSSFFSGFATSIKIEDEKERTQQTRKLSGVINLDFSENDQGKEAANPERYKVVLRKLTNLYVERKKLMEEMFYQSSTTQYNLSSENLNERFSLSTLSWKLHLFSQIYGKYLKDFKKTDLIVFPSSSPGSTSFDALLPALLYCQSLYNWRLKRIFYEFIQDIKKGDVTALVRDLGKTTCIRFSKTPDESLKPEQLKFHCLPTERIISNQKILFHQKLRKFLQTILSQDSSLIHLFHNYQNAVLSDCEKTKQSKKTFLPDIF